jgi:hypothetical protein
MAVFLGAPMIRVFCGERPESGRRRAHGQALFQHVDETFVPGWVQKRVRSRGVVA